LGEQIINSADATSRQTPLGLFAYVVIGFLMENPTSSTLNHQQWTSWLLFSQRSHLASTQPQPGKTNTKEKVKSQRMQIIMAIRPSTDESPLSEVN
jgi:hypothetical protein